MWPHKEVHVIINDVNCSNLTSPRSWHSWINSAYSLRVSAMTWTTEGPTMLSRRSKLNDPIVLLLRVFMRNWWPCNVTLEGLNCYTSVSELKQFWVTLGCAWQKLKNFIKLIKTLLYEMMLLILLLLSWINPCIICLCWVLYLLLRPQTLWNNSVEPTPLKNFHPGWISM